VTRLIRIVIAAAAAAALLCPAVAHAQPPGHSLDTAAALAAGDTADGTFDAAAGADWYRVEVARTPVTLAVTAAHTNDECQVFVRVQNIDGLTLAQASLLGRLPQRLGAQAPAAGPYFVVVDAGPYADCSGSAYRLDVALTVPPFAKSLRAGRGKAIPSHAVAEAWCEYYTDRASALSVLIRRTKSALRHAHGARRRRLARKLAHARREHHTARARQAHWCGLT
jgi:hypothetical protein